MAPHSSTLAWKIPWMEEPDRLQSMGLLRFGHDYVTSISLSLSFLGEGNDNPLLCSCLENPRDGGAWWAAVYGVAQNQTRLKWLSSSNSSNLLQSDLFLSEKMMAIFSFKELAVDEKFPARCLPATIQYRHLLFLWRTAVNIPIWGKKISYQTYVRQQFNASSFGYFDLSTLYIFLFLGSSCSHYILVYNSGCRIFRHSNIIWHFL